MTTRKAELDKYVKAYSASNYAMGEFRKAAAIAALKRLPNPLLHKRPSSFLDMGCGRGEMLKVAHELGYEHVQGTETVPQLIDPARGVVEGFAHYLPFPDKFFDVSMMCDVIEHLIPGDDEKACKQLARVTKLYVILSACNRSSNGLKYGMGDVELHINRRPYDEWHSLFVKWFAGASVKRLRSHKGCTSEFWLISL